MKKYRGFRIGVDGSLALRHHVSVCDERGDRALDPRHDLRRFSDVFRWGVAGAGSKQLALALIADATGDDRLAVETCVDLSWSLFHCFNEWEWELTDGEIAGRLETIRVMP